MYAFTPTTGEEYTITGPLSYSFGNYRVCPRDANDVDTGLSNDIVETFSILKAYPNPFNPEVSINFSIKQSENVEIVIYDIIGNKVVTLFNDYVQANTLNTISWNATNYSSGEYFLQLNTNNYTKTHKISLIK